MSWHPPEDWSPGEVVASTKMSEQVYDNLAWLGGERHHCQVVDSSLTSSAGAWVNPSWSSVTTNVGSMGATSTGFVRISTSGFWLIGASATFSANATSGARAILLSTGASGGGTAYAQSNTTQHAGNASAASVTTALQVSAVTDVYLGVFSSAAHAVTNVRMWAIWMTT